MRKVIFLMISALSLACVQGICLDNDNSNNRDTGDTNLTSELLVKNLGEQQYGESGYRSNKDGDRRGCDYDVNYCRGCGRPFNPEYTRNGDYCNDCCPRHGRGQNRNREECQNPDKGPGYGYGQGKGKGQYREDNK